MKRLLFICLVLLMMPTVSLGNPDQQPPEDDILLEAPEDGDVGKTPPAFMSGVEAYRAGDYRSAFEFWNGLRESDFGPALHNLGVLYEFGRGVAPNHADAAALYERAADHDIAHALNNLARLHARGHGAARDEETAADYLEAAAELELPEAQFNLGVAYLQGRGVDRDETEAAANFELAAEAGYVPAQYNLAGLYHRGQGVGRDPVRALHWYETAARAGDALAHYGAGVLRLSDEPHIHDDVLGFEHMRAAARAGVAPAQNQLGVLYAHGVGTEMNAENAMMWFTVSASLGSRKAEHNRDTFSKRLDKATLKRARARARTFRPELPRPGGG